MIPLLVRLTGLSPALARAALWVALIAALVAAWGLHQLHASSVVAEAREAGVAAGTAAERAAWEARVAEERQRQAAINDRAAELAMLEQARLRNERDELAKRLEDLDHEALLDPDRDRLCLSAGGVRRLDAIR